MLLEDTCFDTNTLTTDNTTTTAANTTIIIGLSLTICKPDENGDIKNDTTQNTSASKETEVNTATSNRTNYNMFFSESKLSVGISSTHPTELCIRQKISHTDNTIPTIHPQYHMFVTKSTKCVK